MDYERMKRVVDGNMEIVLNSRQFLYDVELTDKTKRIIREALERAYNGGYRACEYASGATNIGVGKAPQAGPLAFTTPPSRPEADEVTHFATVINGNGTETGGVSGSPEGVGYWVAVYLKRGYNVKTEPYGDGLMARWSKSQGMTPAIERGR